MLDRSLLPDGNHDITVVARDPAGNARTSAPIIFRTAGGFPNLEGELFVADRQLTSPVGIATDNTGDVYVADVTKIFRFSPAGTLVATYGSDVSAQVDGGAAQVRFGRLKGLGRDCQAVFSSWTISTMLVICRWNRPASGVSTLLPG